MARHPCARKHSIPETRDPCPALRSQSALVCHDRLARAGMPGRRGIAALAARLAGRNPGPGAGARRAGTTE